MNLGLLKGIQLEDIQSHAGSYFSLVPGVNVIEGPNDVGKSAVIRAVRALIYFGPMYIRAGQEDGRITLEFEDLTISRYRREKGGKLVPGGQHYEIGPVGKGEKYQKLGRTLPDEIAEAINMARVEFEDGVSFSLNIAEQIPQLGPFLLGGGYNGQARVKILGTVTEQHLFDEGARAAKNEGRSAKKEAKTIEKLLQEARDNRDRILEEPDYQETWKQVESLQNELLEVRARREKRQQALRRLKEAKQDLEQLRTQLESLPDPATLRNKYDELADLRKRSAERTSLVETVSRRTSEIRRLRESIQRLPSVHRVAELLGSLEDLRSRRLGDLLHRVRAARDTLTSLRSDGTGPSVHRVRRLLGELEDLRMRSADRSSLHDRYGRLRGEVERLRGDRAESERGVREAQERLSKFLENISICPYAPEDIEFQSACREQLDV